MRFSEDRAGKDTEHVKSTVFKEISRKVKSAFSRKRKITLFTLILTILERKGLTLSMELRRFKGIGLLKENVSKTAYLKQRKRLNPEALLSLCHYHSRGLYDDGEMKDLKGYYLLAADGSSINIPTTEETVSTYGTSSSKGTRIQAGLGLSCLYDCINKTILTCSINRNRFNEATEAEKHISKLPELIGDKCSIITLDRAYPSLPMLLRFERQGQKFVIRLSSNDFRREQQGMKTNDERVDICITKNRLQHYKGTDDYDMPVSAGSVRLRMVKVILPSGTEEYLITNLTSTEFNTEEVSMLYSRRWCIETAFDTLKNKLCLENFTGTKPILIEQDIYASIYICNLASDMIADAEAELANTEATVQNERVESPVRIRKYPMAVNRSYAIGILKDLLITAILADTDAKKGALFKRMVEEVKSEVLPIRRGRSFKRADGKFAGKYSNSRKPAF